MPTYRGNRGNLLQHWVLAELLSLIRQEVKATARLCFIDGHAMSPYAVRDANPGQAAAVFDSVGARLPGQGSAYERAWHALKQGRCLYPSSASLVRALWNGPLRLVLCEAHDDTANEIADWHRTLSDTRMDLHRGDWRERFRQGFPGDANSYLVSFDPYMFDRHGPSSPPNLGIMWPSDIVRAAAGVSALKGPVVLQLSTYSANNANAQDDVHRSIEPVFSAAGLEPAATVRADGNMMSMVFIREASYIRDAELPRRFDRWLEQATALNQPRSKAAVASEAYAPPSVVRSLSTTAPSRHEYLSGGTATTRIGYVNRNRQRCGGHRGVAGTAHGQRAYRMECLDCGHVYGANGTDLFQRCCPKCGDGAPGIPF